MKDEIKEILDKLKDTADTSYFVVCGSQEELDRVSKSVCKYLSINNRQANILLDYITNLQEENEELKVENEKLTQLWLNSQEKRRKAIEYLEQPYRDNFDYSKAQLSNILQGSDKDEIIEIYRPNDKELIYAPSELEDYAIDIEKIIEEKDKEIERLKEKNKKLQKEVEKLQRENNVLRSLVPNNEEYYFSVR